MVARVARVWPVSDAIKADTIEMYTSVSLPIGVDAI
jgi:hypothetical protein